MLHHENGMNGGEIFYDDYFFIAAHNCDAESEREDTNESGEPFT
jgi:hypothetical protein